MVSNPKLWRVIDNTPSIDEAIIKGFSNMIPELAGSGKETDLQKARKIEAALIKIDQLEEEYANLARLASRAGETVNADFEIRFTNETLTTDKASGARVKELTLHILDDAIKINRLEYMTAYLALYKAANTP